jgi:CBS domain-containing protein
VDVAAFLALYPPFSSLDADRLAAIARAVEIAHYPAGHVILEQGGPPATSLFMVRKGAVEVLDDGVVLDLLGDGELFGQFSLLDGVSPVATIRALEDTLAYLLPRPVAMEVLSSSAGTSVVFAAMRRRLTVANDSVSVTRAEDRRFATIGSLIRREPVTIEPDAPIAAAAAKMAEQRVSSLLIPTPEGLAILTDRDLRAKVVATKASFDAPAIGSATMPARTLPASTLAGDALLEMFAQGVHHFPVTDGDRVVGVVTDTDLMGIGRHTPFAIKSAIERADTREDVIAAGRELPNVVTALVDSSADPVSVGGVIALVIDALTERFVVLAGRSMGDAPASFAWLSLGSAARHEQALRTDQDHALAYQLPAGVTDADVDPYLAELAEFVTSGLEAVGIPRCTGDAMAVHPAMRRSLEQWTDRFRRWMNEPDLDARILSSIGFDFRRVAGPLAAEPVLDAAVREARAHPAFIELLARGALTLKPPTGFLRDLVVEARGEHAGRLDVKHGGITIVTNIARAVGIAAGSASKDTLSRLAAAAAAGTLDAQVTSEMGDAFRFLWQIRLRHQVAQVEAGEAPDDFVDPSALGPLDRSGLKEAFRVIRGAQTLVSTEFGVGTRLGSV